MKTRRMVAVSTSRRIVEHMAQVRGFSDADLARAMGERKSFIGMVNLGELPLTLDHVEQLAEAVGLPLGAFLLAAMPPLPVKNEADADRAAGLQQLVQDFDHLSTSIDRARLGPPRQSQAG